MSEMTFSETGLPKFHSPVFHTVAGTPYLKEAGVIMIAHTTTDLSGVADFLDGFDESLGFDDYLSDPTEIDDASQLVKFSGQLCYLSHGKGRSTNAQADKYLNHIIDSGHGSVLEHAVFSFLIYGIDRSVTHEAVRHRLSSFSQVSQRYVDGTKLRFVMRPEFQQGRCPKWESYFDIPEFLDKIESEFLADIDDARENYERRASRLLKLREYGHPLLQSGQKTEARKQVNQAARSVLPNETEAPLVMTANIRAWRNVLEQRASAGADIQICDMAMKIYRCLDYVAPLLFADYRVTPIMGGLSEAIETDHRKV